MNRKEVVFRRLGCDAIEGRLSFTQLALSKELRMSLSIVNSAVKSLEGIGAVVLRERGFEVISLSKLLLYWATHRNLKKDIVYQTRVEMPVKEIERTMPDGIAFTGYSGYRLRFGEAPADYSEAYAYATDATLEHIKKRFSHNDKIPNVIILRCDSELENEILGKKLKGSSVCAAQLFADLWNMNQWYAKDFVDALSKRLGI
jgi:hypothetical protein